MDSLELVGAQGKDLVRYTFSFTEWEGRAAYAGSGTYRAQAGESLWQYANRWGAFHRETGGGKPPHSGIYARWRKGRR